MANTAKAKYALPTHRPQRLPHRPQGLPRRRLPRRKLRPPRQHPPPLRGRGLHRWQAGNTSVMEPWRHSADRQCRGKLAGTDSFRNLGKRNLIGAPMWRYHLILTGGRYAFGFTAKVVLLNRSRVDSRLALGEDQ